MEPAKTVSVVCPENLRAGYKNIPEAEFDPAVHQLFDRATGKPVLREGEIVAVEIPDDWRSLHHNAKIALAEKITGADLEPADGETKTAAAERVIDAEIAKRSEA